MFLSRGSGGFVELGSGSGGRPVGLLVAEHGQDDSGPAAGETDERGVVFLAFGAFAVVEGLGLG
jgi:hypothetical protein